MLGWCKGKIPCYWLHCPIGFSPSNYLQTKLYSHLKQTSQLYWPQSHLNGVFGSLALFRRDDNQSFSQGSEWSYSLLSISSMQTIIHGTNHLNYSRLTCISWRNKPFAKQWLKQQLVAVTIEQLLSGLRSTIALLEWDGFMKTFPLAILLMTIILWYWEIAPEISFYIYYCTTVYIWG